MARIWKEPYEAVEHLGLPDASPDVSHSIAQHHRAPTLIPHEVVFVNVCSFTFRFDTEAQLRKVLAYYEQELTPSNRESEAVWSERGFDHAEAERWFERLPLFLREEPKRRKVVKALREALEMFSAQSSS